MNARIAPISARLVARFLDFLIIAVCGILISIIGIYTGLFGTPEAIFLLPLAAFLYETPLIATRGQTLGKLLLRVKVVGIEDGLVPGWNKALRRTILPMAIALVLVVGWIGALLVYASSLWHDLHRGWHDHYAKTLVVSANMRSHEHECSNLSRLNN